MTTQETVRWFKTARPNPNDDDFRVQLGVHLEEIAEMLATIEVQPTALMAEKFYLVLEDEKFTPLPTHIRMLESLSNSLKAHEYDVRIIPGMEVEFLDSLCDQNITGIGLGHTKNMDMVGAIEETNASNFSKFDVDMNPIYDSNGKVIKGPLYKKPNLEPFV